MRWAASAETHGSDAGADIGLRRCRRKCHIGKCRSGESAEPARYVAEGIQEIEDVQASLPDCSEGACRPQSYEKILILMQ